MIHSTQGTLFCLLLLLTPLLAVADQPPSGNRFQASLRAGVSDDIRVRQAEVATDYRLPWGLRMRHGWSLQTELQAAIGWIGDDHVQAPIGSLGPALRVFNVRFPVSMVAGSAPTLIGRNTLGGRNFGSVIQFTSHISAEWRISHRFSASYRVHHMSNAGLGSDNPGINLHMAGIAWHF
jgi:hypothetical protein